MASNMNQLAAIIQGLSDPSQRGPMVDPRMSQPIAPPQMDMGGIMASFPRLSTRRTVGNVLSDFFSGDRIARNMRDPGRAAIGDALGNLARVGRGEDPEYDQTQLAQALQERFKHEQAQNALAALFNNDTPENRAALAQYAPEQAFDIRNADQAREDKMNQPIEVGGNLVRRTPAGGYETVFEKPEEWKTLNRGDGSTISVNTRTGEARMQGGERPQPLIRGSATSGLILVDPKTGKTTVVGPTAKPPAAGATTKPTKLMMQSQERLNFLPAVSAQIDAVEGAMKNLEEGGWTGVIGGRVPAGLDAESDQFEAEVGNLRSLVRQLTRVAGEGSISDYETKLNNLLLPSRTQTPEGRRTAIAGLRRLVGNLTDSYKRGAAPQTGQAPSAPLALPKIGTVQAGYRFKGGNPANQSSWEKVE